jgi:hypothetical protein
VITHGTDTMVETAGALAKRLERQNHRAHRRNDPVRVRQLGWPVQSGQRLSLLADAARGRLHRDETGSISVGFAWKNQKTGVFEAV